MPLAPLPGETDICTYWLICTKCNAKQFLFEEFVYIIGIFGSAEAWSESTLPFQYNVIY